MRVIYLVRGAQLLITLRALWMLYSVSSFCEKTKLSMNQCPDYIRRIPFATPEQIAEHLRIREQRPASNRPVKITSNATSTPSDSTTTTHVQPTTESSTVTSSTEEIKSRKKRDERRELPGNGMTEVQRKAVEAKKEEEKKEKEKKTEVNTTLVPTHVKEKKDQTEGKKEGQKPELPIEKKSEEKREVKREDTTSTTTSTVPTTVSNNDEKKEHLGAEVDAFVKSVQELLTEEKNSDNKTNHAHFSSSIDEKPHHTVKKDLKAHVQEPVELEKKEVSSRVPNLTTVQQRFVLEHSDAFLHEVRCLEVTSDDYFGKQLSPFSEHLKGLAFIGPVLVVIAIYLVCTVLRTRLGNDNPTEFVDSLGRIFHMAMWTLISLTMAWIAKYWAENWNTASNRTFMPEFPCAWFGLALLASFMSMCASIEMWFHKKLYYDLVLERSYRCYEVIDNSEAAQNSSHLSRTNVY